MKKDGKGDKKDKKDKKGKRDSDVAADDENLFSGSDALNERGSASGLLRLQRR